MYENSLIRIEVMSDFFLLKQVGVGAAIVLQSLIGTIGTLMGCCGNKQVFYQTQHL